MLGKHPTIGAISQGHWLVDVILFIITFFDNEKMLPKFFNKKILEKLVNNLNEQRLLS